MSLSRSSLSARLPSNRPSISQAGERLPLIQTATSGPERVAQSPTCFASHQLASPMVACLTLRSAYLLTHQSVWRLIRYLGDFHSALKSLVAGAKLAEAAAAAVAALPTIVRVVVRVDARPRAAATGAAVLERAGGFLRAATC